MIITDIVKKRKGLSLLYIDGEAAAQVDSRALLESPYRTGSSIDDEELHRLVYESHLRRAYEKGLYLLGLRSHSKKELCEKIVRSGMPRDCALAAVEKIEGLGLLDDEQYAHDLARSLITYKKYGLRRAEQELRRKGIDTDIIESVLWEYESTDPKEKIRDILQRKYPAWQEDEKVKRRAVAALQRLGYSYEDIRGAIAEDR